MSTKETQQTEKTEKEKGFWASLSFSDYIELLLYIGLAVALIYEAIDYFN